ncbi:uncharacterized protein LTR77_008997 [Saxophila tyrrhenica]|uniref:Uncharacterized protein n=1 Tax=Saxophila tyrrhenica TaxID=1690608 RepID=A0AAV9P1A2_9PEZI|nr:hypothetical protein LTR77_008997 [Saxophila tyrrhenica]
MDPNQLPQSAGPYPEEGLHGGFDEYALPDDHADQPGSWPADSLPAATQHQTSAIYNGEYLLQDSNAIEHLEQFAFLADLPSATQQLPSTGTSNTQQRQQYHNEIYGPGHPAQPQYQFMPNPQYAHPQKADTNFGYQQGQNSHPNTLYTQHNGYTAAAFTPSLAGTLQPTRPDPSNTSYNYPNFDGSQQGTGGLPSGSTNPPMVQQPGYPASTRNMPNYSAGLDQVPVGTNQSLYESVRVPETGDARNSFNALEQTTLLTQAEDDEDRCPGKSKKGNPCSKPAVPANILRLCARHLDIWHGQNAPNAVFFLSADISGFAEAKKLMYPQVHPLRGHEHMTPTDCDRHADPVVERWLTAINTPWRSDCRNPYNDFYLAQQKALNYNKWKRFRPELATIRCYLMFKALAVLYTGGESVYPRGGDNDGYGEPEAKLTFWERIQRVEEIMTINKRVCLDVLAGRGVLAFVECPNKYEKRKLQNKKSNKKKKEKQELGEEEQARREGEQARGEGDGGESDSDGDLGDEEESADEEDADEEGGDNDVTRLQRAPTADMQVMPSTAESAPSVVGPAAGTRTRKRALASSQANASGGQPARKRKRAAAAQAISAYPAPDASASNGRKINKPRLAPNRKRQPAPEPRPAATVPPTFAGAPLAPGFQHPGTLGHGYYPTQQHHLAHDQWPSAHAPHYAQQQQHVPQDQDISNLLNYDFGDLDSLFSSHAPQQHGVQGEETLRGEEILHYGPSGDPEGFREEFADWLDFEGYLRGNK